MVRDVKPAVKQRREAGRILQPLRRRRFLVAAFGDAGHAFPAIGLARALRRRGHEVVVETWERWREAVEAEELGFTAAEEYVAFPPPRAGSEDGTSLAGAALALAPYMEEQRFDVVVSDILTLAPALAAERVGLRRATLIPHVYPVHEPGLPFFAIGALPPRTPIGRGLWRAALPVLVEGLRRGREEMNESRTAVGLPEIDRFHGGISEELALVATFPHLEYARRWPAGVQVTGPIEFELPHPDIELPAGDPPLVLVAPSTAQDPQCRLIRVALEALADEPVRVLATTNRQRPEAPLPTPPSNAVLVDWLSYSQAMAAADLVICHGGHGTVARSLGAGVPALCCPALGDMTENGARVAWSGAGLMLPWRLLGARALRSTVRRILGDPSFHARASEIAAWERKNDGANRSAALVEALAGS
jgi:UDP:flavonoid glycosyltransferase YjiC (YdhE family)